MSAGADKAVLRAHSPRRRGALAAAARAAETAATISCCLELLARLPAGPVASYLASGAELDLDGLHRRLWDAGTRLLVPRVAGPGLLAWSQLRAGQPTVIGAHGIREVDPGQSHTEPLPETAVLLVPGLAFAPDGRRLGQGGGYYDRLLVGHAGVSVGVGFACQRCDELPGDAHDQRVAGLILGGILLHDPLRGVEP
jgi:5-formyltetrahydrofolate cyclo-ligase